MYKRSTKFYRKNEREVMECLGLRPTKNSGSGWIEKEDGDNDYVICQLKSTDAQSIKVNQKDLRILEHNAAVSHKLPLFAIQFLNTNEVWLLAKPEDFPDITEYINTGQYEKSDFEELDFVQEHPKTNVTLNITKIKSSKSAREEFHNERNRKYDRTKSAR